MCIRDSTTGDTIIGGDLTVLGDDITMGTNTSGHILVADGTNYNPVAVSGDVTISNTGAVTIAATSVEISMLAGSIANAKLANDSVSYGGVSLDLGGTDATPAFNLCDATAYKGDSALVTSGALNSGSITSGFGNIDNGSSTITTTGAVSTGALTSSGNVSFDGGTFVFNESGADKDFRIEGDSEANLFIADASTDRIGIGTATPDGLLHVYTASAGVTAAAAADELILENSAAAGMTILSGNTSAGSIFFGDDGSNQVGRIQYDHNANCMIFSTSAAEVMRIDSSGRLGVNNTSPSTVDGNTDVIVVGDGNSNADVIMYGPTDGNGVLGWTDTANTTNQGYLQYLHDGDHLVFGAAAAERMRVNATGAGIGTTAPNSSLEVYTNSGSIFDGIRITNACTGGAGGLLTFRQGTTIVGNIQADSKTDDCWAIRMGPYNATCTVTILQNSIIGIANTSPTTVGCLNTTTKSIVIGCPGCDGNVNLTMANCTNGNGRIAFTDSADNTSQAWIRYDHNINDMDFKINDSERIRILSSGGITFNGDTAAANALDDYEEGTWTPVVKYGGTGGTAYSTGSANVATYTKIGRVVYIAADYEITNPSASNDTNTVILTGLPFTSANIAQWWRLTTALNKWTKTNGAGVIGAVGANGDYVALYKQMNNGTWDGDVKSQEIYQASGSVWIGISGFYHV